MSADFDASEFFAIFVQEAVEQIEALDQALVGLERHPQDTGLITEIFRAAHSLKASAASQGLERMSQISHALESLFDQVRSGAREVTPELIDLLLTGVDALRGHLAAAQTASAPPDDEELMQRLHQSAEKSDASSLAPQTLASPPPAPESPRPERPGPGCHVSLTLSEDCLLPAARLWLVLQRLQELGEVLESRPRAEELNQADFAERKLWARVRCSLAEADLHKQLCGLPEVDRVEVSTPAAQTTTAGPSPTAATEQQTVRVNMESIDALMNLVGELVISRTRLSNLKQQLKLAAPRELPALLNGLEQTTDNLGRIVTELHERVMETRMVPVEQVFARFPRLVRDAARRENKQVKLVLEGGDTELDTGLTQSVIDPLKHLLRNAVGHGVERPEQRRARGKPEEGLVRLAARQQGGSIVIEVSDDGAGMDPKALREAAVRKGLMNAAQAAALTDQAARQLIFAPGFSTALEVSDVSGRGVGMDVVMSNIEQLGGEVEVTSELGQGTKVELRLPLTLAIIRGLLVESAGLIFALPLACVERALRLKSEEISYLKGSPAVTIEGEAIPLLGLAEVCGLREAESGTALVRGEESPHVVLVSSGQGHVGLMIDSVLGNEELVIQSLGKTFAGIKILGGAAILGDGRLALVVDVPTLLRTARGTGTRTRAAA
ncbi:MAG TPA: chemotaxis protein CheA [Armatimonadota bacterium]|jgi:two-component system chemotaxis sensor kinase CheA